jgi:uncharacterized protein
MNKSVLCWLATAESLALIVPVVFRLPLSPRPAVRESITSSTAVCLSFVDPFVQKGFKTKGGPGLATYHDGFFASRLRLLIDLAGSTFPFSTIFVIDVVSIKPILAPSYRLYPATVKSQQVESAVKAYGVRAA